MMRTPLEQAAHDLRDAGYALNWHNPGQFIVRVKGIDIRCGSDREGKINMSSVGRRPENYSAATSELIGVLTKAGIKREMAASPSAA